MGFFFDGKIYSMNNVVEFLKFPPLGWVDRIRLGLTVLYAQFVSDWHKLESIGVEDWLVHFSGRHAYESIWLPMLNAKFDGGFDQIPATYIWARLVRMKSTRSGANQKEEAGHLIGGYITLIRSMVKRIEESGGKIHLQTPISEIVIENDQLQGVQAGNHVHKFDKVVSTLQPPIFRRMIPSASVEYQDFLSHAKYLGIICPKVVLDRPLSGYWTLNLTDDRIPFTGVIETTSYIAPQFVGGHHLVYLPKYTAPGSPLQKITDTEIKDLWIQYLELMFPQFDRSWIRYFLIHRERYVEPLHSLNETHFIPSVKTPVKNLYLATTAQIYPALTNGESVSRKAREVAELICGE